MYLLNEYCTYYRKISHTPTKATANSLFYAQWVGHYVCKHDFHIVRKNMPSYLILYTVRGNATLRYRGKKYSLSQNSVFFIDCRHLHEYFPCESSWEFFYLHFSGAQCKNIFQQIYDCGSFLCDASGQTDICDKIKSIYSLCENDVPGDEIRVSMFIYQIMYFFMMHRFKIRYVSPSNALIDKASEYMRDNFNASFSVSDVAGEINMSRGYFSKLFKQQTGISPHEYITNYRINHAKHLLSQSNFSIYEISEQCGFEESSSFIRTFRRVTGVTPLCYRKTYLV